MIYKCMYKPCGWRGVPTILKGKVQKECPKCKRPTAKRES